MCRGLNDKKTKMCKWFKSIINWFINWLKKFKKAEAMNKINIPFKGMTNVPDDSYSQDGSMSVLLNMRHKGGELVQCQPPMEKNAPDTVLQVLYHPQSDRWLELLSGGELSVRYGEKLEGNIKDSGVNSFAIMGNIVIMYLENSVEYAIWRNGDYVYLGELPEAPWLEITTNTVEESVLTEGKYDMYYNSETSELYNGYVQKGFIDHALSLVYKQNCYIDRAFFIVALKLFDGTYIATSSPYQISSGETTGLVNTVRWSPFTGSASDRYKATASGLVPTFKILDESIEALERWEDVIVSIDIFTSGSIMNKGVKKATYESKVTDGTTVKVGQEYEMYDWLKASEIKENIENATFRKVAEFDLSGNIIWSVEDTSPSNLAVQEALTFNPMHSYASKGCYTYNSRMHICDYRNILYKGHSYYYFMNDNYDRTYTVYTFIKIENGVKIVKTNAKFVGLYAPGYIIYPDSRAFKMQFFSEDGKYVEIPLKAHRFNNYSFYINVENYEIPGSSSEDESHIFPAVFNNFVFTQEGTPPKIDSIVEQPNVLKVSAVDNPFYFPTAQTYKFEGNIVGLASNAEAISTGQFGQYPLFVFTTEGIWAMAVDASGQGAYVSQSPFSREVCSGAVCPVSGGIVFTTERGVMAISRGQVTELSAPLDGMTTDYMEYQEGFWEKIYEKAGFDFYFQPEEIREYIKGAKLAYNYLHNEVILSNRNYDYSYVYSLANQEWSIINRVFDITTNSYPELVVYNNDKQLRYEFTEGNDKVPVVAITRPVKVETLDFKRLRQAALRCTFGGSLNFYVLGSNDGVSFVCITGKECPTKSEVESGITSVSIQRDLITSMSRSKQYKYIAIAVAGNMRGRISLAEMLVEGGFASNQLR